MKDSITELMFSILSVVFLLFSFIFSVGSPAAYLRTMKKTTLDPENCDVTRSDANFFGAVSIIQGTILAFLFIFMLFTDALWLMKIFILFLSIFFIFIGITIIARFNQKFLICETQ